MFWGESVSQWNGIKRYKILSQIIDAILGPFWMGDMLKETIIITINIKTANQNYI